jgi:hypothetical protein
MTRFRNVLIALMIAAALLVVQGDVANAGGGGKGKDKPVPTEPTPTPGGFPGDPGFDFPSDPGFDAFPGDGGTPD